MTLLRGLPISPGFVIAPAFVLHPSSFPWLSALPSALSSFPYLETPPALRQTFDLQYQRLDNAREEAFSTLQLLHAQIRERLGDEEAAIFEAQRFFLEDDDILAAIKENLASPPYTAEAAIFAALETFEDLFLSLRDPHFQERRRDLRDAWGHVLHALQGSKAPKPTLHAPCILVAASLSPSQIVSLPLSLLRGIATEEGGSSGHVAILAKSLQIPYVSQLPDLLSIPPQTPLALDGSSGLLFLSPPTLLSTPDLSSPLSSKPPFHPAGSLPASPLSSSASNGSEALSLSLLSPSGIVLSACQTPIHLSLNLSFPHEIPRLPPPPLGIGLLRSEFFPPPPAFLDEATAFQEASRPSFQVPSEEDFFTYYQEIFGLLGGRPVVFRLLDLGADKRWPALPLPLESDPALGLRGFRLLLQRPALLRSHLRALLRLSPSVDLRLLLPMISTVREVRTFHALLASTRRELLEEGASIASAIRVGIMLETPSSALLFRSLAPLVSFVSVGTNDLLQFVMACQRDHPSLQELLSPVQPAFLRLLSSIAQDGLDTGVCASICGEIASEPLYLPLLLGLGFRHLSLSQDALPRIAPRIAAIHLSDATALARQALQKDDTAAILDLLQAFPSV